MPRSKTKIQSKNSGNLTFLGLKNKNQNKYGSKHIANYYKDVEGVIQLADSTLVNCDRPPPVALKGRSGPGRSLDRRFKRITYEKKQKLMNVVLYIGSN